jgi:hypothetical protein
MSVFLDETGILLGLNRTNARSELGTRAYAVNRVSASNFVFKNTDY